MSYLPQETIRRKRDGEELDAGEIRRFVEGLASGAVGDAQAAAFAMAVCLRGMSVAETVALTLAMRDSGRVLRWPDDGRPVLDKHSTGGVGDKVSLILAPLLAACGARVPMISGRGLGHTGGTLDKLDSIPGYDTRPDIERFRRVVDGVGCAIVGQTSELAPADGRLYAIRDITATVESIPLITASILSKKLAAGLDALVMDVKFGSGAFLPEPARARELARSIVSVAEAIALLRGERADARLYEVVLALAAEALELGGIAEAAEARARAEPALGSGAAAERFARMVRALGGPADLVERAPERLPRAPVVRPVPADRAGFVTGIDVRALGLVIVRLGGGRTRADAPVDHRVGLTGCLPVAARVAAGDPLAFVHAADADAAATAVNEVRGAFVLGETPPDPQPVIRERIPEPAGG